jgi:hypothetical protein
MLGWGRNGKGFSGLEGIPLSYIRIIEVSEQTYAMTMKTVKSREESD